MVSVSSDPTRIDIEFDPTVQRMQGVARHGMTPFDVPFISEIADNLWQGGCRDGLVLPGFVRHVVSLYPWERYATHPDLLSEHYVEMYDSTDQGFEQLDEIAGYVNVCRRTGPTLVHCQAGLNRSSLVAARALFLDGFGTGKEIVAHVRAARSPACLCNPAFEAEALSWM